MTIKQEIYFEIRYKEKVTDYKKVSSTSKDFIEKAISEDEAREKYQKNGGIDKYICNVIEKKLNLPDFTKEDLNKIKLHFKEYHDKYSLYFREDREDLFDDPNKCLEWFREYENTCCYCGVDKEDAEEHEVFVNSKRGRGKVFEIERVVTFPTNDYSMANCRLACHICNNAKSDFLSISDFKVIAQGIHQFWENKLCKDIDFPTSIYEQFK